MMTDIQKRKICQRVQIVMMRMINIELVHKNKNKIVVMILRMKDDQENKKCQIVLIVIVKKNEGKPTKIKKNKRTEYMSDEFDVPRKSHKVKQARESSYDSDYSKHKKKKKDKSYR